MSADKSVIIVAVAILAIGGVFYLADTNETPTGRFFGVDDTYFRSPSSGLLISPSHVDDVSDARIEHLEQQILAMGNQLNSLQTSLNIVLDILQNANGVPGDGGNPPANPNPPSSPADSGGDTSTTNTICTVAEGGSPDPAKATAILLDDSLTYEQKRSKLAALTTCNPAALCGTGDCVPINGLIDSGHGYTSARFDCACNNLDAAIYSKIIDIHVKIEKDGQCSGEFNLPGQFLDYGSGQCTPGDRTNDPSDTICKDGGTDAKRRCDMLCEQKAGTSACEGKIISGGECSAYCQVHKGVTPPHNHLYEKTEDTICKCVPKSS